MNVTIFGTGTWAMALARVLSDNQHDVLLVGKEAKQIEEINQFHTNSTYFSQDIILSPLVKATLSLEEGIVFSDYLIMAVPSHAFRELLTKLIPFIQRKVYLINTTKGFDGTTKQRFSDVIRQLVPKKYLKGIVSLLGPSHAEEVIQRQLTLISSTSQRVSHAQEVANLFANSVFRVYVQKDEIGAEVGAAMKNVIAIASGVITGLGLGDNARAALVTRGLTELMRLGKALGGKLKTHTGLTGLGDMIVTCYSPHSRNYQAGIIIGQDNSAQPFLTNNKRTIEGIPFAKVARDLAIKHKLHLPIIEAVYAVLYEKKKPSDMVKYLMNRPLKVE
jgi:glycerol-3-phosphate dehydrogenase (NAD(P)+)